MWGSCQEWQNPNPRWGRVRAGWLLNKGAGLWHQHSATYNAVLRSLPRHLHSCSHLVSGDLSRLHDRVERGLMVVSLETSGGNDPHLVLQSHVTSYMINSGSTTLSKHDGHQGLNTWGSPAVGFRTEEAWIRGEYLPVAFFNLLRPPWRGWLGTYTNMLKHAVLFTTCHIQCLRTPWHPDRSSQVEPPTFQLVADLLDLLSYCHLLQFYCYKEGQLVKKRYYHKLRIHIRYLPS